jgi:hypothetical protein
MVINGYNLGLFYSTLKLQNFLCVESLFSGLYYKVKVLFNKNVMLPLLMPYFVSDIILLWYRVGFRHPVVM